MFNLPLKSSSASRPSRRAPGPHSYLGGGPTSSSLWIGLRAFGKALAQGLPQPVLAAPIPLAAQELEIRQMQPFSALLEKGQEEKLFLDGGSQMQKVQNLADTGATDFTQAGQVRLIGDGAAAQKAIKADGQGHEPGQTRYTNGLGLLLEAPHVLTAGAGQRAGSPPTARRFSGGFPFLEFLGGGSAKVKACLLFVPP